MKVRYGCNRVKNIILVAMVFSMALSVLKITPFVEAAPNQPPVAIAEPEEQIVYVDEEVFFDGSNSYDLDGAMEYGPNVKVNTVPIYSYQYYTPDIDVDDFGNIHVVWLGQQDGDVGVYYAKSTDGGKSFKDTNLVADITVRGESVHPKIAVDSGGTIHIVWYDIRPPPPPPPLIPPPPPPNNGCGDPVYYAKSTDGGMTFDPILQVNDDAIEVENLGLDITVDNSGMIFVSFVEYQSYLNHNIHVARSINGGISFETGVKVNDIGSGIWPLIDVDSLGIVHTVWTSGNSLGQKNNDIYYSRSLDRGLSFNSSIMVNSDPGITSQFASGLTVDSNDNVHITFADACNGDYDIYYSKSTNNGMTFSTSVLVSEDVSGGIQWRSCVAVDINGFIHAVWEDCRNDAGDVYHSYSTDGGKTFSNGTMVNEAPPNHKRQYWPVFTNDIYGNLHVIWTDYGFCNDGDIYYSRLKVDFSISFSWDFGDGSEIDSSMNPTHVFSNEGVYTVTLTVADASGATDTDTCNITVTTLNRPPVADAGENQVVFLGETVQLDGTGSYDHDFATLCLSDDFEDGDASEWYTVSGSASVKSGNLDGIDNCLLQIESQAEIPGVVLFNSGRSLEWFNCQFEAEAKIADGNDIQSFLYFYFYSQSYMNIQNTYMLQINAFYDKLSLIKYVDGVEHIIGSTAYPVHYGWHNVKINANLGNIEIYLNNELKLDIKDDTFTRGTLGFGTSTGGGGFSWIKSHFDNININVMEPSKPLTISYLLDNFEDEDSGDWFSLSGSARVQSGNLNGFGNYLLEMEAQAGITGLAMFSKDKCLDWFKYQFDVDAKIANGNGAWSCLNLYFYSQSYTDINNTYMLQMNEFDDTLSIIKYENGLETVLGTTNHSIQYGIYHVKIIANNGILKVYLNDQFKLDIKDSTFTKGTIGLGALTSQGGSTWIKTYFDNVGVTIWESSQAPSYIWGSYENMYLNGTIETYHWDLNANVDSDGDGDLRNDIDAIGPKPTFIYNNPGVYTVILKVKDDDSATDTDTCVITVLPENLLPQAKAGPDREIYEGETVNFDASESYDPDGSIVKFIWDFGDGSPIKYSAIVSHTYDSTGIFTFTLTVSDAHGAQNCDTGFVTVTSPPNLPPIANAGSDQTVHLGDEVFFDGKNSYDQDGVIIGYIWCFEDGIQGTGVSQMHVFNNEGIYNVALIIKDNENATAIDTIIVTVKSPSGPSPISENQIEETKIDSMSERPLLILTAGLSNIGSFKEGSKRTVPVEVTAYYEEIHNVKIVLLDDAGLLITIVPKEENIAQHETVRYYLDIQVPELEGNTANEGRTVKIQAFGDEISSNIEYIDIKIHSSTGKTTKSENSNINGVVTALSTISMAGMMAFIILVFKRR